LNTTSIQIQDEPQQRKPSRQSRNNISCLPTFCPSSSVAAKSMPTPDLERIRLDKPRQFLLCRLDLVDRQSELIANKDISIRKRQRTSNTDNVLHRARDATTASLTFALKVWISSTLIADLYSHPVVTVPGVSMAALSWGPVTFQLLPRSRYSPRTPSF